MRSRVHRDPATPRVSVRNRSAKVRPRHRQAPTRMSAVESRYPAPPARDPFPQADFAAALSAGGRYLPRLPRIARDRGDLASALPDDFSDVAEICDPHRFPWELVLHHRPLSPLDHHFELVPRTSVDPSASIRQPWFHSCWRRAQASRIITSHRPCKRRRSPLARIGATDCSSTCESTTPSAPRAVAPPIGFQAE